MKRAVEKKKLWKKISAAFMAALLWGGVLPALPVEAADPPTGQIEENDDSAAEEGIQIPGQVLLISKDSWTNRTVEMHGNGNDTMTLYGGTKAGQHHQHESQWLQVLCEPVRRLL